MERCRQLVSAVLAGMLTGIGGTVCLSVDNIVVGSFLFAIGIFAVVIFKLQLFTGKVCYSVFQHPHYCLELFITWFGNLLGAFLTAQAIRHSRIYPGLAEKVLAASEARLNDSYISLFFLAVFCGVMIFVAVESFQRSKDSAIKLAAVFVPVMVFISSGFENVIADMYFFSLAGVWSWKAMLAILVMSAGNGVGGLLIPAYQRFFGLHLIEGATLAKDLEKIEEELAEVLEPNLTKEGVICSESDPIL